MGDWTHAYKILVWNVSLSLSILTTQHNHNTTYSPLTLAHSSQYVTLMHWSIYWTSIHYNVWSCNAKTLRTHAPSEYPSTNRDTYGQRFNADGERKDYDVETGCYAGHPKRHQYQNDEPYYWIHNVPHILKCLKSWCKYTACNFFHYIIMISGITFRQKLPALQLKREW